MSKTIGKGVPTSATPGIPGQEYYDIETGKSYICTAVNYNPDEIIGEIAGSCVWEEEISSLPDTVATKAYVDEMLGVIENGTY